MAKTTQKTQTVSARFDITLNVSMDMGTMTLEQALAKARDLKVTDVVNLNHLGYNDGYIKLAGVLTNG